MISQGFTLWLSNPNTTYYLNMKLAHKKPTSLIVLSFMILENELVNELVLARLEIHKKAHKLVFKGGTSVYLLHH